MGSGPDRALGEKKTWQMSFNASKCHVLTITRTDLQKVNKAKYLDVDLTKDLHGGAYIRELSHRR